MPETKPMPFLVAETTATGDPNLGGRRRLADNPSTALEVADEIDGQAYALEAIEPAPFAPKPAVTTHVANQGWPFGGEAA